MSGNGIWESLVYTRQSLELLKRARSSQRDQDAMSDELVEQLFAQSRAIRELSAKVRKLSEETRMQARKRSVAIDDKIYRQMRAHWGAEPRSVVTETAIQSI